MKTKKKKIANRARKSTVGAKKALQKPVKRPPKAVARKKRGSTVARAPKKSPETTVAVYEVVETRVYEEPDIVIDDDFGT